MKTLDSVGTIFFCDETKFYIADGDAEDAIYYFTLAVEKRKVPTLHSQLKLILKQNKVQAKVFHSTTLFKETRPRKKLMHEICQFITENELHCFCFKYNKALLYEPTKKLNYLNDENIFDFNNVEFQALFYFLLILNTHLRDDIPGIFPVDIAMYFDRNVYGKLDIEAFNFARPEFVIKQMTFSEKSLISLLALPDFFGYIFRKSKISKNKADAGVLPIEISELSINSYVALLKIVDKKLFHFLDIDKYVGAIEVALGIQIRANSVL